MQKKVQLVLSEKRIHREKKKADTFSQQVAELESDVNELPELFDEMKTMVGDQQILFDEVEKNLQHVTANSELANSELECAERHQVAVKKKRFCLVFIFLLCLLFFSLAIFFSV